MPKYSFLHILASSEGEDTYEKKGKCLDKESSFIACAFNGSSPSAVVCSCKDGVSSAKAPIVLLPPEDEDDKEDELDGDNDELGDIKFSNHPFFLNSLI
ncbi:hypothetical protein AGMMS49950_03720 [Endomicrobiia bacterium]|nr:hypothetical protein AGMMS49531_05500 [Endomicrobiia bacterium]GHT69931.1 hypothetical protein AGMMS49950_03720 [Endomicrobiia bacterium]